MAITLIQQKTVNSGVTAVTNFSITLDAPPTPGNVLILCCACLATGVQMTITPDANITWTGWASSGPNNTGLLVSLGRVFAGAGSTITVTGGSSGGFSIALFEYSGNSLTVDRFASASGTSNVIPTGTTGTTTAGGELWLGAICHRLVNGTTFSGPTNGFSILAQDKSAINVNTDRSICVVHINPAAVGVAGCNVTANGSGAYQSAMFTIQEGAVVGGGGEIAFGSAF